MYPRMFTGKFTTLKIHVTNALLYLKVPAVPLVCTYHLLIYVCTFVCLFTLQLPYQHQHYYRKQQFDFFQALSKKLQVCFHISSISSILYCQRPSFCFIICPSVHCCWIVVAEGSTFYLCFMFLHTNQFHDPQYLRHCRRH